VSHFRSDVNPSDTADRSADVVCNQRRTAPQDAPENGADSARCVTRNDPPLRDAVPKRSL